MKRTDIDVAIATLYQESRDRVRFTHALSDFFLMLTPEEIKTLAGQPLPQLEGIDSQMAADILQALSAHKEEELI